MIGLARRVAIAFVVEADRVVVLRLLYGGRDLARALGDVQAVPISPVGRLV